MLDIQRIRQDTESVKRGLATTGTDPSIIDQILLLDTKRRSLQQQGDDLRAQLNVQSKNIGKEKDPEKRQQLINGVSSLKNELKELGQTVPSVEDELFSITVVVSIVVVSVVVEDGLRLTTLTDTISLFQYSCPLSSW